MRGQQPGWSQFGVLLQKGGNGGGDTSLPAPPPHRHQPAPAAPPAAAPARACILGKREIRILIPRVEMALSTLWIPTRRQVLHGRAALE